MATTTPPGATADVLRVGMAAGARLAAQQARRRLLANAWLVDPAGHVQGFYVRTVARPDLMGLSMDGAAVCTFTCQSADFSALFPTAARGQLVVLARPGHDDADRIIARIETDVPTLGDCQITLEDADE